MVESVVNYYKLDVQNKKVKVTMPTNVFEGILLRADFYGNLTVKTDDGIVVLYPRWINSLEVLGNG